MLFYFASRIRGASLRSASYFVPHTSLQPFFTTKLTGQGTGLGLSLSYDIVKAHGVELRVKTEHIDGLPAEALAQAGTESIISLPFTESN